MKYFLRSIINDFLKFCQAFYFPLQILIILKSPSKSTAKRTHISSTLELRPWLWHLLFISPMLGSMSMGLVKAHMDGPWGLLPASRFWNQLYWNSSPTWYPQGLPLKSDHPESVHSCCNTFIDHNTSGRNTFKHKAGFDWGKSI